MEIEQQDHSLIIRDELDVSPFYRRAIIDTLILFTVVLFGSQLPFIKAFGSESYLFAFISLFFSAMYFWMIRADYVNVTTEIDARHQRITLTCIGKTATTGTYGFDDVRFEVEEYHTRPRRLRLVTDEATYTVANEDGYSRGSAEVDDVVKSVGRIPGLRIDRVVKQ